MPDELANANAGVKEVLTATEHSHLTNVKAGRRMILLGPWANDAATAAGYRVIVTGDRDSLRLVDDHVTVKLVTNKARTQTPDHQLHPENSRKTTAFEPVKRLITKA